MTAGVTGLTGAMGAVYPTLETQPIHALQRFLQDQNSFPRVFSVFEVFGMHAPAQVGHFWVPILVAWAACTALTAAVADFSPTVADFSPIDVSSTHPIQPLQPPGHE